MPGNVPKQAASRMGTLENVLAQAFVQASLRAGCNCVNRSFALIADAPHKKRSFRRSVDPSCLRSKMDITGGNR